ncbi:uncharacterized protein LOC107866311 [Capsicum annuum]|uniref:uncharacterized protein LOC107866311 n=1 Tax=Capsicum annuum TaxID=4072 RepID=UPI0007BF9F47|nr:uncharacterized protein LOC107866311 [Capsicum annuum]XP_016567911.1 uncharacterized protein LOC107866311 [Capsicum annuum]
MDTKQELWDCTKAKYEIPNAAKDWVLERIRESWRKNRRELKRDHYDRWENDEVRLLQRPKNVTECQFIELLLYWKSKKFQAQMEEIKTQQGSNKYPINAFSAVMGAKTSGTCKTAWRGVTKTSLKILNDGSKSSLNGTNDVVQQMEERMRKMRIRSRNRRELFEKKLLQM